MKEGGLVARLLIESIRLQVDDGARQCARDPFDALDASNDELAEIVDVLRLGAHDHVVRPGHVFRREHAFDLRRRLCNRCGLADFGLDQDVCVDHRATSFRRCSTALGTALGRHAPAFYTGVLRWQPDAITG